MADQKIAYDDVRKRIWDQLVHLHDVWDQYRKLYTHSPERVQLLNRTARWFFASLQRLLIREALLGVSRLTDPRTSRGRSNLVLSVLLDDPLLRARPSLRDELARDIGNVLGAARTIRLHRNRYIAHIDQDTAVQAAQGALPAVVGTQIDEIIAQMEAIYHRHSVELYESHPSFELSSLGSVDKLVQALERAERLRQHELAELRRQLGVQQDVRLTDGPDELGAG